MSSLRPTSRLFGRALFGDQDLQLRRLAFAAGAILVFLIPAGGLATMQRSPVTQPYVELQHEAIRYYTTKTTDPVAKLQARVERGEVQLQYDEKNGYLASLLSELDIDVSSQLLVASKTSLQIDHISPATPRAIYFNDAVYVGWVQGGPAIEISAVDPKLGAVFYTVDHEPGMGAKFERKMGVCLQCHNPSLPSHVMTSMIPDPRGQPVFTAGLFSTSDQSPFPERWGGWYVTGTHGGQVHMGNLIADVPPSPPGISRTPVKVDRSEGANQTQLVVDTAPYLGKHSDIVALMVLGHQVNVGNLITNLGYETRKTLHAEKDRENGDLSPEARSRIEEAADSLVRAMLFVGEVPLTSPIDGTSGFTDHFASRGPLDSEGQSLRQLDLSRRLFRYPLSYLVYSDAFQGLPEIARHPVYRRLWEVLGGADRSPAFAHLSDADRGAILEILEETESRFAAWRAE